MNITRRYFLKSTGALAVYCGIAPLRAMAEMKAVEARGGAQAVKAGKTLVVIFLRGGMDGVNFIVPHGEAAYYKARTSLAIPPPGKENGAVDLDGFFGLHPRGAALVPLFQSGQAVALQAVGYDKNTRSHFEEQDTWETGMSGNTLNSDGWLNRHLATSKGRGPVRAVAIGSNLPRILRGKAAAYSIRGLQDLALPNNNVDQAKVVAALEHAYCVPPREHVSPARDLLAQTGQTTLEGIGLLSTLAKEEYKPRVPYPDTGLGRNLKEVARIIKAKVGLEVAEIDHGGWDTHNNQGGAQGPFGNNVQELSDAVAAFAADLEGQMDDVLLVTLSDFGRTIAQNGSQGTDHGWANCLLAVGGPIAKQNKSQPRKVAGNWPGLEPEKLHDKRDLAHTTDFRDVIAELVRVHLGNPHLETVLPQHKFQAVGLIA